MFEKTFRMSVSCHASSALYKMSPGDDYWENWAQKWFAGLAGLPDGPSWVLAGNPNALAALTANQYLKLSKTKSGTMGCNHPFYIITDKKLKLCMQ